MTKKKWILLLILGLVCYTAYGQSLFAPSFQFTGTLETTEHNVGVRQAGRLNELLFEEGSRVKKGDLLAKLDRFEQTQKDYQRAKKTFEAGGLSAQTLEQAALALEDQQVFSPMDGEVLIKVHQLGEVVTAGSPIAVIGDLSKLWVRLFVREDQVNRIHLGDETQIRMDGLKETFVGHVIFISSKAEFTPRNVQTPEERVTQTFAVKVEVENPLETLRPGTSAEVWFKGKA